MVEAATNQTIEEEELSDYFGDPTCYGKCYFVPGVYEPALQLHLFPETYTLFWESDPKGYRLIPLIGRVFEETLAGIYNRSPRKPKAEGKPLPKEWSIAHFLISALVIPKKGKGLIDKRKEFKIGYPRPAIKIENVGKEIEKFTLPKWPKTVSYLAELRTFEGANTIFSFWTDTETISMPQETGIEGTYGNVPTAILPELLQETSPIFKGFQREYLTQFVNKIMDDHTLYMPSRYGRDIQGRNYEYTSPRRSIACPSFAEFL